MSDPQRFEDELARIVASDDDPANWKVPHEFEGDPEFQVALDEYARVAREISGCAQENREVLAEAREEERPDDRASVAAAFARAGLAVNPAPPEGRAEAGPSEARAARDSARRSWTWIGSLAALFVAMFLARALWFDESPTPVGPDQELGGQSVELLRPLGPLPEGAPFGAFEWRFELPENGHFEVRVYDDELRASSPTTKSERLTESQWTPETTAGWPWKIRWEVVVRDASGSDVAFGSGSASRSD